MTKTNINKNQIKFENLHKSFFSDIKNTSCLISSDSVVIQADSKSNSDPASVELSFKDNQLVIDLYDKGKPAIPQNIKPRAVDDIKPGGLGTFFIGQIMDEVTFKTLPHP